MKKKLIGSKKGKNSIFYPKKYIEFFSFSKILRLKFQQKKTQIGDKILTRKKIFNNFTIFPFHKKYF